jgi:hypothetical protein
MIFFSKNTPIYPATTLSGKTESSLIFNILPIEIFQPSSIRRLLCAYPMAIEDEKDIIICELMNQFWKIPPSRRLFPVFKDFDKVCAILEKRGHFIHQFEVFLLGCHIINLLITKDVSKIIKRQLGSTKRIYFAWLFASTAHDFGYPLQLAQELLEKFSGLYKKIHIEDLAENYSDLAKTEIELQNLLEFKAYNVTIRDYEMIKVERLILDGIRSSIVGNMHDAKTILELIKGNKKKNHGYISALILCRTYIEYLSKIKKWKHPNELWRFKLLKKIAASILLHSIPFENKKYIKKISFNKNPLAYLLFLIDNIQEWNRSLRPSKDWPSYNLIDFHSTLNSISLKYLLSHEEWNDQMEEKTKEDLEEKTNMIKCLTKPDPPLGFTIKIIFLSNHNKDFGIISLKL